MIQNNSKSEKEKKTTEDNQQNKIESISKIILSINSKKEKSWIILPDQQFQAYFEMLQRQEVFKNQQDRLMKLVLHLQRLVHLDLLVRIIPFVYNFETKQE